MKVQFLIGGNHFKPEKNMYIVLKSLNEKKIRTKNYSLQVELSLFDYYLFKVSPFRLLLFLLTLS